MSSRASSARLCVVVTAYARADGMARLLDDIEREFPDDVDVRVYDDASPTRDLATERRLSRRGWAFRRAPMNHGKRGWWRWWNEILTDLRAHPAELYVGLQDDIRLCDHFLDRSLAEWHSIEDPRKASLYLHISEQRAELGTACWTPVSAEPAGRVVRTGWVDLSAFVFHRRLFDALDWRLDPVPSRRWQARQELSSGVGQQISVRAHAAGLGMYRVERALVVHDDSPSLMNAEARRQWPMATMRFVDGEAAARRLTRARPRVNASLASISNRERGLARVVENLLPQVDRLQVYLNGYDRVPSFLDADRIEVARSQQHGDRGDAGKFYWAAQNTGYQLVCDDDIDYPADYVDRLVAGVERHLRRAVVGFHGSVLHHRVDDYYRSRKLLHMSSSLGVDCPVHVLGTGVAAYHTATIPVGSADFHSPDMADIWLAVLGQRRHVPFMVLRHRAGWLTEIPGFHEGSLYQRGRRSARSGGIHANDATRVIHAQAGWRLYGTTAPPAVEPPARRAATRPPVRPAPVLLRVPVTGPRHRATLVLPDRDHITTAVQGSGTYYERDLLDAVRAHSWPGVYVDVGAHYGNHAVYFAIECDAEHVVAIEPNPPAYAGLEHTVTENGLRSRVTLHRVAAHPRWRNVNLRATPWRPRPGQQGWTNSGAVMAVPCTGAGDAPAAPLDRILEGLDDISVVKVDVAASAAEVLASGRATLERHRPIVVADAASAVHRASLRVLLDPLGYLEEGLFGWTSTSLWRHMATSGLTAVAGRA